MIFAKGQLISKQNCRAVTSPKKRTSCASFLLRIVSYVRFLGEVTARQFCFEINWPLSTAAKQQVNYALYFKRWPHCGGVQARLHKLMGYCSDVYISETLRLWSFKWGFLLATSDPWLKLSTFWLLDTSGFLNPLTLQEFRIHLSFYFVLYLK